MSNENQPSQDGNNPDPQDPAPTSAADQVDGLKDKKPEDLTPEELRLMADTMPGEGPGD